MCMYDCISCTRFFAAEKKKRPLFFGKYGETDFTSFKECKSNKKINAICIIYLHERLLTSVEQERSFTEDIK